MPLSIGIGISPTKISDAVSALFSGIPTPTWAIDFARDQYSTLSPALTVSSPTGGVMVPDYQGNYHKTLAGEIPIRGGRRVENLRDADLTVDPGYTSNATVSGNDVTLSVANNSWKYFEAVRSFAADTRFFLRFKISCAAGERTVGVRANNSSTGTNESKQAVTVGPTPVEVWFELTLTVAGTPMIGLDLRSAIVSGADTSAGTFTITEPFIQIARPGQTEPDPEYVSRGVFSSPYHGYGVDGLAWMRTDPDGNSLADAASGYPVLCTGIADWPQITNLQRYSNALASWVNRSNVTVTDNDQIILGRPFTRISPSATGSANRYAFDNIIPMTSGVAYTAQAKIISDGADYVQLTFADGTHGAGQYANFDLSTGALGDVVGGTATIRDIGSSVYLCTFSATATATAANGGIVVAQISSLAATRVAVSTLDTADDLLTADVHINSGAVALPFVPTAATAVTADAIVKTLDPAAIGLTAGLGTFVIEHTPLLPISANTSAQTILRLAGTAGNTVLLYNNSNNLGVYVADDSVVQWNAGYAAANWTPGELQRIALRLEEDDGLLVTDGAERGSDSAITLPAITEIQIGGNASSKYAGSIGAIAYYAAGA